MQITLNGESREVAEGLTVAGLLSKLELHAERVAVELNLTIVDRPEFGVTALHDGDRVEVIGFIGGGEGSEP